MSYIDIHVSKLYQTFPIVTELLRAIVKVTFDLTIHSSRVQHERPYLLEVYFS